MKCVRISQTLSIDLLQQQNHLKEAIDQAKHEDTDMVIVSQDKQFLPFQKSLLLLFSPVIANVLSTVPACASPTFFLPDFPASHIKNFLDILQSEQTLTSQYSDDELKYIHDIANLLEISKVTLSIDQDPLQEKIDQINEDESEKIIKEEYNEPIIECSEEHVINEIVQEENNEHILRYSDEDEVDKMIKHENTDKAEEIFDGINNLPWKIVKCEIDNDDIERKYKGKIYVKDEKEQTLKEILNDLTCPKCKKIFRAKIYMRRHTQLINCEEKSKEMIRSKLICPKCKKMFRNFRYFKRHTKLNNCMELGDRIVCSKCETPFKMRKYLLEHIRLKKCFSENEQFQCLKCDKSFFKKGYLIQHNIKNPNCFEKNVPSNKLQIFVPKSNSVEF